MTALIETDGAGAQVAVAMQRAARLAHDLNNVFTPITGYASLARDELKSGTPDVAQLLSDMDVILAAAARGAELTRELMRLGASFDVSRDPSMVTR